MIDFLAHKLTDAKFMTMMMVAIAAVAMNLCRTDTSCEPPGIGEGVQLGLRRTCLSLPARTVVAGPEDSSRCDWRAQHERRAVSDRAPRGLTPCAALRDGSHSTVT